MVQYAVWNEKRRRCIVGRVNHRPPSTSLMRGYLDSWRGPVYNMYTHNTSGDTKPELDREDTYEPEPTDD